MKTQLIVPTLILSLIASSCYAPVGAHSPYSRGGRIVTPAERAHSPHSPGGVVVLPREARRVTHRGVVYHTHNGVWYRAHRGGYVVCPAPY